MLRLWLNKKVKGIDDDHVGNHLNVEGERRCLFREDYSCLKITKWILLPVDEVICRVDLQRIAKYRSSTVRCGLQPENVWGETNGAVVLIRCVMMYGNFDRHGRNPL